jgi:2-octaprenyl-6-methoxyphenol hydroxylase
VLRRLGAWPAEAAQPITAIHVSQAGGAWALPGAEPVVHISAAAEGVTMLGAVLSYGALVARLQQVWMAEERASAGRLRSRFGTPVAALKDMPAGVEVDAGTAETCDLAVVAEGGVYTERPHAALGDAAPVPLRRDYHQTAWVGSVTLEGATPGLAFERFTRHGPAALLPLLRAPGADPGSQRAALVWCVDSVDDPVRELDDAQRLAVLATIFPAAAGRLTGLSVLKDFALGLNAERRLVQGRAEHGGPGRTVRIGNAAQTLHPVAGQGLNLGLRDAYQLVAALRFADDLDAALRRVEWARAPDRWSLIAGTDLLARGFTWGGPALSAVRGLGLAALQAAPPVKSWLVRRMMFGSR